MTQERVPIAGLADRLRERFAATPEPGKGSSRYPETQYRIEGSAGDSSRARNDMR
jgi:hypothetical protein